MKGSVVQVHTMDRIDKEKAQKQIEKTFAIESASIAALAESYDLDRACELIELLHSCQGKVITTGCGTSGVAAKKIAHTLSCIQIPTFFLTPSDALHGAMGVVTENDIVIFISKGGMTEELYSMLQPIKKMGAKTVAVCENADVPLSQKSDLFIKIKIEKEPDVFNMLATASTLSVIAYFDAITIALQELVNFKKENFLTIHPGGKVGNRLQQDVYGSR